MTGAETDMIAAHPKDLSGHTEKIQQEEEEENEDEEEEVEQEGIKRKKLKEEIRNTRKETKKEELECVGGVKGRKITRNGSVRTGRFA